MEQGASRQQAPLVLVGFAALAILAGPVRSYSASGFGAAMHFQMIAGSALSGVLAGIVLLSVGVVRREGMPRGNQWLALLVLLLPQWLGLPLAVPYIRPIPWLHETPWGVAFLLTLAAPLWLALLSALELVPVEVPRAVAGAAIAGIGAVYFVVPVEAYRVSLAQAPVLVLQLLLNILIVFSWAYAAPRVAAVGTFAVAGSFLLVSAMGDLGLGLVFERSLWQPVDRHEVLGPLLLEAAVVGCSCWLWFWLLARMSLAAFGLRALGAWTATIVPGFVLFGFREWRLDVALVISLAALMVGLRAHAAEEQPLALGLRGE